MARASDIVVSFSFHFILLLPSLKLCISYFRVVTKIHIDEKMLVGIDPFVTFFISCGACFLLKSTKHRIHVLKKLMKGSNGYYNTVLSSGAWNQVNQTCVLEIIP